MRKSGKKAVQVGLLSRKILSRSLPPIANRVVSPLSSPKPIPLPGGSSHLPMPTTVYPVGVLRTPNSSNSRTTSRKRSRVDIEYERKGEGGSPKRSKSTLSHKDNSELLKKQAPADWEKTLGCIQDMRKADGPAPVDTMGCERLADESLEPAQFRFQTLVALMLSSQTKDQVTAAAMKRLQSMEGGLSMQSILEKTESDLAALLKPVGFFNRKAAYLKRVAVEIRDKWKGDIPSTVKGLCSLPGVGPKMSYLTLQVAWKRNVGIGVDLHVHRIANRLGWVSTTTPEKTRKALEDWLPEHLWTDINPLLVGFGQLRCKAVAPKCTSCAAFAMCPAGAELQEAILLKKQNSNKTKTKGDSDR